MTRRLFAIALLPRGELASRVDGLRADGHGADSDHGPVGGGRIQHGPNPDDGEEERACHDIARVDGAG